MLTTKTGLSVPVTSQSKERYSASRPSQKMGPEKVVQRDFWGKDSAFAPWETSLAELVVENQYITHFVTLLD